MKVQYDIAVFSTFKEKKIFINKHVGIFLLILILSFTYKTTVFYIHDQQRASCKYTWYSTSHHHELQQMLRFQGKIVPTTEISENFVKYSLKPRDFSVIIHSRFVYTYTELKVFELASIICCPGKLT